MEDEAIVAMLKEGKENRVLIGSLLECSVRSALRTDNEATTLSEEDHSAHSENDESGELEVVEAGHGMFVVVEAGRRYGR